MALRKIVGSALALLLLLGAAVPASPPALAQERTIPPVTSSLFAYGFQVHLWQFNDVGKTDILGLVELTGFNWIKHQVEWSAIEVAPGEYAFGDLDAVVAAAQARNVKVLLSVVHAPEFRRGPFSGYMPANPEDFNGFMQVLAGRYPGRVHAYEMWNEQNLDRETGPGNVDPNGYLQLLKAGYTGTKAGDPTALVLLGATSPTGANIPGSVMDDLLYLEQLFAINDGEVRAYYDALGAHPSGFSNPPDCTNNTPECSLSGGFNDHDSFFAFDRVRQYRRVMEQAGDTDKKIWFTEFGYASTDQPVPGYEYAAYISEQQQAEFLVRAFAKAQETGYVGGMIVWNFNYQMVVPKTDEKWAFGVIRDDWSGRPAFNALMAMPKP